MLWESVTDSCDVYQCTRLFKNVFKIRGTPESAVKARSRGRRMNMVSRRLSSPELSMSIDKENDSPSCSPLAQHFSPLKVSKRNLLKSSRLPLEDCDINSQDSGYGANTNENPDSETLNQIKNNKEVFQFAEPLGIAPRRIANDLQGYNSMDDGFNELVDMENINENNLPIRSLPNGITDLLSGEIVTLSNEKPMECDSATTPEFPRARKNRVRRSLSMQIDRSDEPMNTPPISKVRACLFRSPNASSSAGKLIFNENNKTPLSNNNQNNELSPMLLSNCDGIRKKMFSSPININSPNQQLISTSMAFKRPEPPTDDSPILVKRSKKAVNFRTLPEPLTNNGTLSSISCSRMEIGMDINDKLSLNRCHSESDAHAIIKSAIHRSTTDADLTGDFSKQCILPLAEGHHEDLKSISVETLGKLIRGEYNHCIDEFKIVDCRYPYEFEAGHINGAINLYTKNLIDEFLKNPSNKTATIQPDDKKRNILIFHCEFSWERGPNLSRYLRNIDRNLNKEFYPALHYPEIYLLHGGYQEFYRLEKNLCTPQGYRPMTHPDHKADLRKFSSKSKSWQGEKSRKNSFTARANSKRLGL
ncbi:hypothetical protein PV327_009725 [Microctonus hyperodae]|uniref:protein-tyrosine-phosphatase n=1 Tax=Microctonus hyperodae TaxID=165561 RepID=A0AA39CB27_MICHY|nr:hypothetical protein PV327_009725 [Microctonus hyperodae]